MEPLFPSSVGLRFFDELSLTLTRGSGFDPGVNLGVLWGLQTCGSEFVILEVLEIRLVLSAALRLQKASKWVTDKPFKAEGKGKQYTHVWGPSTSCRGRSSYYYLFRR